MLYSRFEVSSSFSDVEICEQKFQGDETWSEKSRPPEDAERIRDLFITHIGPSLEFVSENCDSKMQMSGIALVETCLAIIQGLLPDRPNRPEPFPVPVIQRLFVFSLMWSIGGLLEIPDRKRFHVFLRDIAQLPIPSECSNDLNDGDETVFDYFVDLETSGDWVHWRREVIPWEYPKDHDPPFSSILVPTLDNVRTEFLVRNINNQGVMIPDIESVFSLSCFSSFYFPDRNHLCMGHFLTMRRIFWKSQRESYSKCLSCHRC